MRAELELPTWLWLFSQLALQYQRSRKSAVHIFVSVVVRGKLSVSTGKCWAALLLLSVVVSVSKAFTIYSLSVELSSINTSSSSRLSIIFENSFVTLTITHRKTVSWLGDFYTFSSSFLHQNVINTHSRRKRWREQQTSTKFEWIFSLNKIQVQTTSFP